MKNRLRAAWRAFLGIEDIGLHPLSLNVHEGVWFQRITGPVDGWYSFGDSGNPPFGQPVQLLLENLEQLEDRRTTVAVGWRTKEIDDHSGKEKWTVFSPFSRYPGQGLTYWRPLSPAPRNVVGPTNAA